MLYDIFWSVKAAAIQLCMHVEAMKWSGPLSFAEESARLNDIHLILIPYSALLDALYQDSSRLPSPDTSRLAQEQMRTLLCLDLGPACIRSKCQCLDGTRTSVQELVISFCLNITIPERANQIDDLVASSRRPRGSRELKQKYRKMSIFRTRR